MANCYLLIICSSSSVDRQTNNASLFNLVERISVRPDYLGREQAVPLEVHSYWQLQQPETVRPMEIRWVVVAQSGLETPSPTFRHRPEGLRFRLRGTGLPLPPVAGDYSLRVEYRFDDAEDWYRSDIAWPLTVVEAERTPRVTH